MLETRAGTNMRVPAFSRLALCEKAPLVRTAEPSAPAGRQRRGLERHLARFAGGAVGAKPRCAGWGIPQGKKKKTQGEAEHVKIEQRRNHPGNRCEQSEGVNSHFLNRWKGVNQGIS